MFCSIKDARIGQARPHPRPRRLRTKAGAQLFLMRASCFARACYFQGRSRHAYPRPCSLLEECGQASVEAAILLPSLLFIIGLMAQPICIFYTRTVMNAAASEAARLVLTQSTKVAKGDIDAFILRRLRAVPSLSIFHEGGDEGWEIELGESEKLIEITLSSKIKPLPLFGIFSAVLTGASDGMGSIVVKVAEPLRPAWLSGSYEDWTGQWGG